MTEPYDSLIEAVRSEMSDADITAQEFSDEDIISEIDRAVKNRVEVDRDQDYHTDDILDTTLVDDSNFMSLTSVETARRLVNRLWQTAARENIAIRKGGTTINTDTLVKGLKLSENSLKDKYNSILMSNCVGDGFSFYDPYTSISTD